MTTYPQTPGHVAGSATSQAAAQSMIPHTKNLRHQVYTEIWKTKNQGLTDDEIEQRLGARHQTISARRRELVLQGVIQAAGTRLTRSNRKATVWVVTDDSIVSPPKSVPKSSQDKLNGKAREFLLGNFLPKVLLKESKDGEWSASGESLGLKWSIMVYDAVIQRVSSSLRLTGCLVIINGERFTVFVRTKEIDEIQEYVAALLWSRLRGVWLQQHKDVL